MKYLLKKYKKIILIAFLPYLLLLFPLVYRTEYAITLPGGITNIRSFISLDEEYSEKGSINSTYIMDFQGITIFQKWFYGLDFKNDIYVPSKFESHLSNMDLYLMGRLQKKTSIVSSIITAYEAAGKDIDYTYKGLYVSFLGKDNKLFKIGDIIVGESPEIALKQFEDYSLDKIDGISVLRNDELIKLNPLQLRDDVTYKRPYWFDILCDFDAISIDDCNPSFETSNNNIGGPSGGLLQSLSIFNRLIEYDYTNGLKIGGTGTITYDGFVGEIGGMEQKIYTAYKNKIDIFFVPDTDYRNGDGLTNYEEAMMAYENLGKPSRLLIVKVKTFNEAIEYLESIKE